MRERVEASAQIAIARIVRFDFFVAGCVATDLVAHAASTQLRSPPRTRGSSSFFCSSGTWLLDSRFRGNERSVLHRSRASQPRLDFQTATAPHPLVVARGLRLMSLPFAGKARGDGAPIGATSWVCGRLSSRRRASRRSIAAFSAGPVARRLVPVRIVGAGPRISGMRVAPSARPYRYPPFQGSWHSHQQRRTAHSRQPAPGRRP